MCSSYETSFVFPVVAVASEVIGENTGSFFSRPSESHDVVFAVKSNLAITGVDDDIFCDTSTVKGTTSDSPAFTVTV